MRQEEEAEVFAIARMVAKEEIKLAFGDDTPLAKQIAKDVAAQAIKEEKSAVEEANASAKAKNKK